MKTPIEELVEAAKKLADICWRELPGGRQLEIEEVYRAISKVTGKGSGPS